jgi:MYXO-CTERM domain-containing protein
LKSTLVTLAAAGLFGLATGANAAAVIFNTAPFAGSAANPGDGVRTIVGANERTLPTFDISADTFVFDPVAFGLTGPLQFASGTAAALTGADGNVIVLQSTDNDANPATPFNAGAAANLIASALDDDRAGFFIYHNSVLGVNRLVFSSNLNSTTSDLAILARMTSLSGAAAIAALPTFSDGNFAVPEPASWALALGALLAAGALCRRKQA